MSFLSLGAPIRWAHAGPLDLTPLMAIVAAVLVMRFVLGVGVTMMTFMLAATAGALWAYAAQTWGLVWPSAVAVAGTALLQAPVRRAQGRWRRS